MIRTKLIKLTVLCLVTIALAGCASKAKVFSDFDARHDFSQDRTFTWVQNPPMLRAGDYIVSALTETRMTSAIKNEFISKGYMFVEDQAEANFSVLYTMGARDQIDIIERRNSYYSHRNDWGWGAYYFPYFLHFPFDYDSRTSEFDISRYTAGTIALDIFDAKTKQPIWHTKSSKRLSAKELNSHAENANQIAISLLQHFPLVGCEVEVSKECKPFN